jgi:hypothetical protein
VSNGEVTAQVGDALFIEDLRHQPNALIAVEVNSVGDRNPGALLPAMLQGEKPEKSDAGDLLSWGIDSEDSALLFGARVELIFG